MRIVVTGGDGFIGSHVVRRFEEAGHDVLVIDLKRGLDIRDRILLSTTMLGFEPDAVVHLAAVLKGDAEQMYSTNVLGTANVVMAAEWVGAKKIVYASSAAVYGNGSTREIDDCHPISDYGRSKLLGEIPITQTPMRGVRLRFFNVYGEGGSGIVNVLDDCIRMSKPFKMFSRKAVRDYVSVGFVTKIVERALLEDTPWGVFNVGTGRGMSVMDVVKEAQKLGRFDVLDAEQEDESEIRVSVADTMRLSEWCRSELGQEFRGNGVREFWLRNMREESVRHGRRS